MSYFRPPQSAVPVTHLHKAELVATGFGQDDTWALIGGGFGLYSSAGMHASLGPVRSSYYRVGYCRAGSYSVEVGVQHGQLVPGGVHCIGPEQYFHLVRLDPASECWYLVFTAEFIERLVPEGQLRQTFPFFGYEASPFLQIPPVGQPKLEAAFLALNHEVRTPGPHQLFATAWALVGVLLAILREGTPTQVPPEGAPGRLGEVSTRFLALVGRHFVRERQVGFYAQQLALSPWTLTRTVRSELGLTPREVIAQMVLKEAKALLRYTELGVAEIAYQLDFADPAHFTRFFRRYGGEAPSVFRARVQRPG